MAGAGDSFMKVARLTMLRKLGNILRRFRPQFGLRTLLLAVTLFCVRLGHVVERWRGEVAALREIHIGDFSKAFARGWWGEEREIAGPDDLQPWETVVRTDFTTVKIDRLDAVLSRLPNARNIGFEHAHTVAEYRALIDLQRKYQNVDINWEICSYVPHPGWFTKTKGSGPRKLTDVQIAEREFYILKGWNTAFMGIPDERQSPSSSE